MSSFLEEGDRYYNEKDYNKAIEFYKKGLEQEPENLQLLENIGRAYFQLKEYNQAMHYLDPILAKRPQIEELIHNEQKALIKIAEEYDQHHNYQKAAESYAQATSLKPSIELWGKQSKAWLQAADYKRAIECANHVLDVMPVIENNYQTVLSIKVEALRKQGQLLIEANCYTEAEKYYEELVSITKNNSPDLIRIANLSLQLQKIDQSIEYYRCVNKYSLKDPELLKSYQANYQKALLIKAKHLCKESKWAEAKSYLNNISSSMIARSGLVKIDADMAYSQGSYEKAKALYLKATSFLIRGENVAIKGLSDLERLRIKDGIDVTELEELKRRIHACHYQIEARNSEAGKEFDQALNYYKKITELIPEDNVAYSRFIEVKGDIAYQEKNLEEALDLYQQAHCYNDNNTSALSKSHVINYHIKGEHYAKKKDLPKAIKNYDQFLSFDKNNHRVFKKRIKLSLKLAVEDISKKNYEKAVSTVISVINDTSDILNNDSRNSEIEYHKIKAQCLLGDILLLENNVREAIKAYDIVLAMRPEDSFFLKKKLYAGFLHLSENQSNVQDETLISLAKDLKINITNAMGDFSEFSKDSELVSVKTFTELPITQIEAVIDQFLGKKNTILSDSQDQFAEDLETVVEAGMLSIDSQTSQQDDNIVFLDSQDELVEVMEVMIEEAPLLVESKKRHREDSMIEENAIFAVKDGIVPASTLAILEPSPKKPKKKSLPSFTPKIKNFEEVASDILFKTERDPATYLAPYWQTASSSEDKLFTAPQESEEEKQQREQAKEKVADEVGLAGEKLVYAKLKSHYAKKYNASIAETKTGFELKGHYGNADRKAGKAVHLQVEWYNLHSKSCKETFNDHDLRITKKIENEAETTRSVEVKTTRASYPKASKFTERELARMKQDYDQYRIFRVYNIESQSPEITKFKNPYKAMFGGVDPELSLGALNIII